MRVTRKAQAAQFAANVLPIIRDIQAAGHTSLNGIAGQLNPRKVAVANCECKVRHIPDRAAAGAGRGPIAQALPACRGSPRQSSSTGRRRPRSLSSFELIQFKGLQTEVMKLAWLRGVT
jgi:hypothetical protein